MKENKSYNLYAVHIIPIVLLIALVIGGVNYGSRLKVDSGDVLARQDKGKNNVGDKGKSDKKDTVKGKSENANSHRKNIQKVVEDLTNVVVTEEFVGNDEVSEDIEAVITDEEEEVDEIVEAIEAVEGRGKWKTFLMGADYKNLGQLRSNLAHNTNSIRKLTKAGTEVVAEGSEGIVDSSLTTLYQERARIQQVIEANENEFSLLGWIFKFLAGYDSSFNIVEIGDEVIEATESTETTETP